MRALAVFTAVVVLAAASACGDLGEADFGLDDVVEALTGIGASVEQAGQAPGFPFSVPLQRLTADGYDLWVHEYAHVVAQEAEAATILMEGWSVNHTPVEWIGSPHYWIRGRVIVIYLGDDRAAIDLLTGALGGELDLVDLPGACSGDDGPSRVEGILWVAGGPPPGLDQPTAGIVWVYPDTAGSVTSPIGRPLSEPITESAVDSTGEFVIHLPPGTYVLAADMVGGHVCESQVVEVGEGGCTPVTITCHIR